MSSGTRQMHANSHTNILEAQQENGAEKFAIFTLANDFEYLYYFLCVAPVGRSFPDVIWTN